MTYSPLTDRRMPPTGTFQGGKKWSARPTGVRINGLNVHHWAGTNMSGLNRLVYSNDPASANYLILNDGTLVGSVPEEYRAWTTSAYANDDDKITVEIQNETGAPSWRVSAAAIATLVRLYADLARRHKFAPTRANLRGHQEYGVATACPGPYLLPRLDDVARRAAALGTNTTPEEPDMDATQAKQLSENHNVLNRKLTDGSGATTPDQIWQRTLDVSRRTLVAVQANNAALTVAMETLAKNVGVDPAIITAAVEKAVREALPESITIPLED